MAGVLSLEQFGNIVTTPGRDMSANYAIDKDARVGLFCEEKDRSWCSSSSWNDNRAITIEVSNSLYGDATGWPISDKVYNKLIDLCVDICQRNGIKSLEFTGDTNGSLTFHCMLAQTQCPGPWIKSHVQELCAKVNSRLTAQSTPIKSNEISNTPSTGLTFKEGQLVGISSPALYYTGTSIPDWVKSQKWYISSISGDRAVLGKNEKGDQNIQSPINTKYLIPAGVTPSSYTTNLKATDLIYTTAGGTMKGTVGMNGVFTITEEKVVNGIKYGKLKSGAGFVKLDNVVDKTIRVGDKVKVLKNEQYSGGTFTVYCSSYTVLEINNDRCVISSDGKNVTCAINIKNIEKI